MADRDTVRTAINRAVSVVIGDKVDYDGTSNYFETDQALGDTPTLTIDLTTNMADVDITRFQLENVRYYMDPTDAVTYQLYLFEAASADNVQNISDQVFVSPAAQADVTAYDYRIGGTGSLPTLGTADHQLPVICNLATANKLYYLLNWSAAPGDTKGYIKIRGKLLK